MTKIRYLLQLLTVLSLFLLSSSAFSQSGRGIDDENYMKKQKTKHYRPSPEERRVMKIEKAQEKKENKQKRRDTRLHKKAVKKHNKIINGGGRDIVDGKKTYKRMKKSKRIAKKNS
ncbi:MAG TPA: hypothetical protein PKN32_13855 [Bacteroidales bacterium]|jgi:hypothetical protein|nr:hypothetical protein [Bacteroidales bacterium]